MSVVADLMEDLDRHPFDLARREQITQELASADNRSALIRWYAVRADIELNPTAEALRTTLEQLTGTQLH